MDYKVGTTVRGEMATPKLNAHRKHQKSLPYPPSLRLGAGKLTSMTCRNTAREVTPDVPGAKYNEVLHKDLLAD